MQLWSLSEAPPNALLGSLASTLQPSTLQPSALQIPRARGLAGDGKGGAGRSRRAFGLLELIGLEPPIHTIVASGARGCSLRCTRLQVLFAFSTCFDDVALADMLAAGLRPGTRVVTVDSMLPNR